MIKLELTLLVLWFFMAGFLLGYAAVPQDSPIVCNAPRIADNIDIERALFADLHERLRTYPGVAFIEGYVQWDCYVHFVVRGYPRVPEVYELRVYVYRWDGESFVFLEAENNPYHMATVQVSAGGMGEEPLIK